MKKLEDIEIGVITGPHGLRGEVSYHPHNQDSALPSEDMTVFVQIDDSKRQELTIEYVRPKPKGRIIAFNEVEDRDGAEALRGCHVFIDEKDLPAAAGDEFYYRDVIGKPVSLPDGTIMGVVTDIFATATDILVVDHHGQEWMIPVVERFVREISPEGVTLEPTTIEENPPQ